MPAVPGYAPSCKAPSLKPHQATRQMRWPPSLVHTTSGVGHAAYRLYKGWTTTRAWLWRSCRTRSRTCTSAGACVFAVSSRAALAIGNDHHQRRGLPDHPRGAGCCGHHRPDQAGGRRGRKRGPSPRAVPVLCSAGRRTRGYEAIRKLLVSDALYVARMIADGVRVRERVRDRDSGERTTADGRSGRRAHGSALVSFQDLGHRHRDCAGLQCVPVVGIPAGLGVSAQRLPRGRTDHDCTAQGRGGGWGDERCHASVLHHRREISP